MLDHLPSSAVKQEKIEAIYDVIDGWSQSTKGVRLWSDLPDNAKIYIEKIENLIEAPVALLSTSPEREDSILVHDPFNF